MRWPENTVFSTSFSQVLSSLHTCGVSNSPMRLPYFTDMCNGWCHVTLIESLYTQSYTESLWFTWLYHIKWPYHIKSYHIKCSVHRMTRGDNATPITRRHINEPMLVNSCGRSVEAYVVINMNVQRIWATWTVYWRLTRFCKIQRPHVMSILATIAWLVRILVIWRSF